MKGLEKALDNIFKDYKPLFFDSENKQLIAKYKLARGMSASDLVGKSRKCSLKTMQGLSVECKFGDSLETSKFSLYCPSYNYRTKTYILRGTLLIVDKSYTDFLNELDLIKSSCNETNLIYSLNKLNIYSIQYDTNVCLLVGLLQGKIAFLVALCFNGKVPVSIEYDYSTKVLNFIITKDQSFSLNISNYSLTNYRDRNFNVFYV